MEWEYIVPIYVTSTIRNIKDSKVGKKPHQVLAATSASHWPIVNHRLLFKLNCQRDVSSHRSGRKCVGLRSAQVTSPMLILNHHLSCIIRYFSFQQFTEGWGKFCSSKIWDISATGSDVYLRFNEVSCFLAVTFESSAHVLGIHTELWWHCLDSDSRLDESLVVRNHSAGNT